MWIENVLIFYDCLLILLKEDRFDLFVLFWDIYFSFFAALWKIDPLCARTIIEEENRRKNNEDDENWPISSVISRDFFYLFLIYWLAHFSTGSFFGDIATAK